MAEWPSLVGSLDGARSMRETSFVEGPGRPKGRVGEVTCSDPTPFEFSAAPCRVHGWGP